MFTLQRIQGRFIRWCSTLPTLATSSTSSCSPPAARQYNSVQNAASVLERQVPFSFAQSLLCVMLGTSFFHFHSIHVHNTSKCRTLHQMNRDRASWDDRTCSLFLELITQQKNLCHWGNNSPTLSGGQMSIVPLTRPQGSGTTRNCSRTSTTSSKGRILIGATVRSILG